MNLTWLTDTFRLLRDCHVFVDDVQIVMEYDKTPSQYPDVINTMLESSRSKTVHIACDIVQFWFANDDRDIFHLANSLTKQLSDSQLGTLSKNLRNTCDLSNILSVFRNRFIEYYSGPGLGARSLETLNMILPQQIPGHFIHGPKTVTHIVKNHDVTLIKNLVNRELDKLCDGEKLSNSDVSILRDNVDKDVLDLVSETLEQKTVARIRCGIVEIVTQLSGQQ